MKNQFAINLRLYRRERNLSLGQLAELTGVSKSILGFYENGVRQPCLPNLLILKDFFRISLDELCIEPYYGAPAYRYMDEIE